MVLIFIGPSCSGKSTVADIIARRTGANVMSGKDYLRLAKQPEEAYKRFIELLNEATQKKELSDQSILYLMVPSPRDTFSSPVEGAYLIKFTASIETLERRFAPRVGGTLTPNIAKMLQNTLTATTHISTALSYDTTEKAPADIAEEILNWCSTIQQSK